MSTRKRSKARIGLSVPGRTAGDNGLGGGKYLKLKPDVTWTECKCLYNY